MWLLIAMALGIYYSKTAFAEETSIEQRAVAHDGAPSYRSTASGLFPLILRRSGYGTGTGSGNIKLLAISPAISTSNKDPSSPRSFQYQFFDPLRNARIRVEVRRPYGRSVDDGSSVTTSATDTSDATVDTSRPSSGIISVTSNTPNYSDGSSYLYGAQQDYSGSVPTSDGGQMTGDPSVYGYTDYGGSNGIYSNSYASDQGSSDANAAYNSYSSDYATYYANQYDQSGTGSVSSPYVAVSAIYEVPTENRPSYTVPPTSTGYVGYGGTFHNYGQHTSYPVSYRRKLSLAQLLQIQNKKPNQIDQ